MEEKNLVRSKRRTAKDIEDAVMKATESLISSKGFINITFSEIMQEAKIEPKVMYKRYGSINTLFDKFIRQYDYWLHDLIDFNLEKNPPVQAMKDLLNGLIFSLYDNPVMQKILIWELSEKNSLTTRMAVMREVQSVSILNYFNKKTDDEIDFNCLASILIGGIYYLILHKDVSTFCDIDFNKEESKKLLMDTIKRIIEAIYIPESSIIAEKEKIALSLLENGVDVKIISDSTGLSIKEIKKLK